MDLGRFDHVVVVENQVSFSYAVAEVVQERRNDSIRRGLRAFQEREGASTDVWQNDGEF